MTIDLEQSQPTAPPEAFIEQVKQVLEHLYDFPYLQSHPLANQLAEGDDGRGQALRRLHLDAIERLNPGKDVPFGASHARVYNLLQLHYVEAMTIQECAAELSISVRQAYRDLRRAEASVAALLWEKFAAHTPQPRAVQLSSVEKEVSRLDPTPTAFDLYSLLRRTQSTIERLAQQRSVQLITDPIEAPLMVFADPALAQQVVTMLWSHAVQHAKRQVTAALSDAGTVTLAFCYQPREIAAPDAPLPPLVQQLAHKMGWRLALKHAQNGDVVIAVEISADQPTVLVIDDNQGLVELLERYLTDKTCRVISALNGKDGLRLAQESRPDAVVLDVMMPGIDGWEVLQLLRARPETATTPVVICSVFNDPELALSLGANAVLPKPVSRNEVLTALRQMGIVA